MQPIYSYEVARINGDLGLVRMMLQIYPLMKKKKFLMYVSYVLSVTIIGKCKKKIFSVKMKVLVRLSPYGQLDLF